MSKDNISGEDLHKWASSLGLSSNIPPESYQKLLTPEMKNIWKHLVKHVRPQEEVDHVRKNLLLQKLKQDKLAGKLHGKLKVRPRRISQIETVKRYEKLSNKIKENNAEINSLTDRVEGIIAELKRLGKNKKDTLKAIEDDQTKILALKTKAEQLKKLFKFNNYIEEIRFVMPSQGNGSGVDEATDLLDRLDNFINDLSWDDFSDDKESRKIKTHEYITNSFRDISPFDLVAALSAKLQQLSKDLAVAATSELEKSMNESELGGVNLEESLKDCWESATQDYKETSSIHNSVAQKREELEKKKSAVVDKVLEMTKGLDRDDAQEWVDSIVNNTLVIERIKYIEEEKENIELECLSLELSDEMYHELEQVTLKCEHNIKTTLKSMARSVRAIRKNMVMKRVNETKSKVVAKIEGYRKRANACKWLTNDNNPFLSLQDFIKSEVLLLIKVPVEALQLVWEPQHITQRIYLPMYSPYMPSHFILQDCLEKICWNIHSLRTLEELMPSPPLDYDVEELIETTKLEETLIQDSMYESVEMLQKTLNEGKAIVQEASESISFWINPQMNQLVTHPDFKFGEKYILEWYKEKASLLGN